LTGTPIQNRLEDIGALFAFLRADPFHSLAQFRRFICIPFDQGETVARDRLILLYDSLVLRRTLNIISLPGQDERIRELELTEEEKRQYDRTFNILNRYMRTQVGQYPGAGSHGFYRGPQFDSWKSTKFGLFQAHLQLRILCNHGTFQKPFSWKKRDTREELNAEREAFITEMGLRSELMCDGCKQPRPILGSTKAQNNFVENCNHSLCHECLEDCHDLRHCPLCQRFGTMDVDMQDGQDAIVPEDTEGNPHHKDYFNPIGFSTKMNALMLDVKDGLAGSKR
jgi:SWI/SNF-related matrix-associated actin-dependent regulator of chromatin subfamily A3